MMVSLRKMMPRSAPCHIFDITLLSPRLMRSLLRALSASTLTYGEL